MKKLALVATATVLLAGQAQATDYREEIIEWVVRPCMEVAAALEVDVYEKKAIDSGIKRSFVAEMMVANRAVNVENLANKMTPGMSWEQRRMAYPPMLTLCIRGFLALR